MRKNNALIEKWALDVSAITLDRLDKIQQVENIETGWDEKKYFSLDVINGNCWFFNFYGRFKNMYFDRIGESNYFKLAN